MPLHDHAGHAGGGKRKSNAARTQTCWKEGSRKNEVFTKLHAAKSYLLHKLTRLLHKASRFNSPLPSGRAKSTKKEKCQCTCTYLYTLILVHVHTCTLLTAHALDLNVHTVDSWSWFIRMYVLSCRSTLLISQNFNISTFCKDQVFFLPFLSFSSPFPSIISSSHPTSTSTSSQFIHHHICKAKNPHQSILSIIPSSSIWPHNHSCEPFGLARWLSICPGHFSSIHPSRR